MYPSFVNVYAERASTLQTSSERHHAMTGSTRKTTCSLCRISFSSFSSGLHAPSQPGKNSTRIFFSPQRLRRGRRHRLRLPVRNSDETFSPPSVCGEGAGTASAFLFGTPMKQLGSCSGPGDVCLVPTISGSDRMSVQWQRLAGPYGLTEDQLKAWLNMHDYRCKNVGKSVNTEVAEAVEKDPDTRMSEKKLKWMWKDRIVYY